MQNNGMVYLVHDDNACVGLIHFSIVHDNHTNDIGNFVLLFPISSVVVVVVVVAVAVDGYEVDYYSHWLQLPWLQQHAFAVVVGEMMIETNWAIVLVA